MRYKVLQHEINCNLAHLLEPLKPLFIGPTPGTKNTAYTSTLSATPSTIWVSMYRCDVQRGFV